MSALPVVLPVEIPGEDVEGSPWAPVPASAVIALRASQETHTHETRSSAEFGGPLKHDGWAPAFPTWDDLTAAERSEHRQVCAGECALCEGHRLWGLCPACGHTNAEANDEGESLCCAARVLFGSEAERAWGA